MQENLLDFHTFSKENNVFKGYYVTFKRIKKSKLKIYKIKSLN